ncbi:MAG: lysylphosphatidylglycerol synthase transmembrane domain-containing protein [Anaerolineae bacterium]
MRLLIGSAIGVAAGWYILRDIAWEDVGNRLGRATVLPVVLAILLLAAVQLLKTLRWQAILGNPGMFSFGRALRGLLVGQALNLLFPLRAGDVVRALLVGEQASQDTVYALYTIVLEKICDVIMALISLLLLLAWGAWPTWLSRSGVILGVVSLFIVMTIAIIWWTGIQIWQRHCNLSACPRKTDSVWCAWLEHYLLLPALQLADGLRAACRDGRLIGITAYSGGVWLLSWATNVMIFWALGISVHWTAALLVLVAIYLGVAVPAPPTRAGTWHFLVTLALSSYGVAYSAAVAYGVLLHLVVVLPLLLAGGVAWINPMHVISTLASLLGIATARWYAKTQMRGQG